MGGDKIIQQGSNRMIRESLGEKASQEVTVDIYCQVIAVSKPVEGRGNLSSYSYRFAQGCQLVEKRQKTGSPP
jgi:hypothetical protein